MTSSTIHILDNQTINQIAAGEVIENPASVVKELVENAIDAEARKIVIEILSGGRQLIRVIDDGFGMNETDAKLCFERHATSKIRALDDLMNIGSMGFRGEAVPSIASISKMSILTSRENEEGTLIVYEGGLCTHCSSAPRSKGTTVEVKSLFYNVPVRRKFQKSVATDTTEVLKIVGQLALANPRIHFQLLQENRILLQTTSACETSPSLDLLRQRAIDVLDNSFAESLPLQYSKGEISLQGFIGKPSDTRPNRTGQYLFINGRAVQCPLISYAVLEGYSTLLEPRRFPLFILAISLPGTMIDVNVHPQKREVRIRSSHVVKEAVIRSVEEALSPRDQRYNSMKTPLHSFREENEEVLSPFPFQTTAWNNTEKRYSVQNDYSNFKEAFPELPLDLPVDIIGIWEPFILLNPTQIKEKLPNEFENGIIFIDARRAHARTLYEQFISRDTAKETQSLLIPLHMQLSSREKLIIDEYMQDLLSLGIHINPFGGNTYVIDALPNHLSETDVEALMHEIIQDLELFSREGSQKKARETHAAMAASRAALKRKRSLTPQEAKLLVAKLFKCEQPFQCPRGRPTMFTFPLKEILKNFGTEKENAI